MLLKNAIEKKMFSDINLSDPFFDSLKKDYPGFENWFKKKQINNFSAYVLMNGKNIIGFLSLKDENESDNSISPIFEKKRRLKISTFKIKAHGTVLGQRFISIILQEFLKGNYEEVYVTIFEKHLELIKLFEKFGFRKWGIKNSNGEFVYVKDRVIVGDIFKDFPFINKNSNKFLLSIYPMYHTDMFPDSKLSNEHDKISEDLSFTNTIEKIYLSKISMVQEMKKGDLIVIYRTSDQPGNAWYRAVATSICTVVDERYIGEFATKEDFLKYCGKGSIFTDKDLNNLYYSKRYPYIVKLLYNVALSKRLTRGKLIEDIGIPKNNYFGCMKLSNSIFDSILREGQVNESIVISKT